MRGKLVWHGFLNTCKLMVASMLLACIQSTESFGHPRLEGGIWAMFSGEAT